MVRGIVPRGSPVSAYSPPVGAGPYRIDDYQRDEAVRLSRHEGYYGGAPPIERVVVKFVPDTNVRFLELKNRITSYNVCYTKLLRICQSASARIRSAALPTRRAR